MSEKKPTAYRKEVLAVILDHGFQVYHEDVLHRVVRKDEVLIASLVYRDKNKQYRILVIQADPRVLSLLKKLDKGDARFSYDLWAVPKKMLLAYKK